DGGAALRMSGHHLLSGMGECFVALGRSTLILTRRRWPASRADGRRPVYPALNWAGSRRAGADSLDRGSAAGDGRLRVPGTLTAPRLGFFWHHYPKAP